MGKKKQARKARQSVIDAQLERASFEVESPNHPMRGIAEWLQNDCPPASYAVVTEDEDGSKNVTLHSKGDGRWFDMAGNLVLDGGIEREGEFNAAHVVAHGGCLAESVRGVFGEEVPEPGTKIHEALEEYQKNSPRPWEETLNVAGFVGYDGIYDGLPEQSVISEETVAKHDEVLRRNAQLKTKPLDAVMTEVLKSQEWDPLTPILSNMHGDRYAFPQKVVVGMDPGQKPIIAKIDEEALRKQSEPTAAERMLEKVREAKGELNKIGVFAYDEAFGVNEQPAPKPNDGESMHDLVSADMAQRKAFGLEKYGTILQAGNLRNAILDAYEESLDHIVYLRAYIEETKDAVVLPRDAVSDILSTLEAAREVAKMKVYDAESGMSDIAQLCGESYTAEPERSHLAQISYWRDYLRKSLEPASPKSQPDQQV